MSDTGWVQVGTIYVDSAAVLIADPAYAADAAEDYFAKIDEAMATDVSPFGTLTARDAEAATGELMSVAYCTMSGEGDGVYPVFERRTQDGTAVAELKIVFISPA